MSALLLAAIVAWGPADPDPDRLPARLEEDLAPLLEAREEPEWWVGAHLGVAGAYDAADPCFLIGFNGRVQLRPWLAVDASLDFQTREHFEHDQIHLFQVPFEFAAIFYPPLGEGILRPYGQAGVGFTITSTDYTGTLSRGDSTDLNLLFFIGFGAQLELSPNVAIDANLRFVFVQDPPHFAGNNSDWIQFTVGVMFKLAR